MMSIPAESEANRPASSISLCTSAVGSSLASAGFVSFSRASRVLSVPTPVTCWSRRSAAHVPRGVIEANCTSAGAVGNFGNLRENVGMNYAKLRTMTRNLEKSSA